MTSPGNPPIIPQRGYTASTIYQLQDVDPDALGRGANADMHGELEGVRGNLFNGLLGGFTSVPAALVPIINGIFNGWFGGGGVGDPLQVQYTIEAIADAVINGYTVETKVTSGTWTKPANITELVVVVIGGGETGENGQASARESNGGLGGGYIAQQIDPAAVAASTAYVVGNANTPSSFGAHVISSPGGGGISTSFGFTPTTSMPGNGGNGGLGELNDNNNNTAGANGQGSALAVGGVGGERVGNGQGNPGTAGGNVSAATTTKCGGGGGGGGSGGANAAIGGNHGGSGGPGGYPGGGGGGGGGRSSRSGASNGAGGIGATGIIWIFWR